jgi:transcriptional regulator with XRE-family HTH domain
MSAGLTQRELARAAGLSQSRVSLIDRGEASLRDEEAPRIARALRCSIDDLVAIAVREGCADATEAFA